MFSFLILYFIEVKRENKLITYLEVNRFTSVDNEAVGEALQKLDTSKKERIWKYDGFYQNAGYISTGAFILNSIFSAIVIYNHYFDSKTTTVFLTNVLFMGTKVADVYATVNTKKNVFYSAYLKQKVQFNDVDPDKILKIEQAEDIEQSENIRHSESIELPEIPEQSENIEQSKIQEQSKDIEQSKIPEQSI